MSAETNSTDSDLPVPCPDPFTRSVSFIAYRRSFDISCSGNHCPFISASDRSYNFCTASLHACPMEITRRFLIHAQSLYLDARVLGTRLYEQHLHRFHANPSGHAFSDSTRYKLWACSTTYPGANKRALLRATHLTPHRQNSITHPGRQSTAELILLRIAKL